jgi:arylsulfatase A-like enzyme
MLRRAGHATGVVGKWHLGLGAGVVDWNGAIRPGPREIGFDDALIMAATGAANPGLLKVKPSHGHDQTIVGGISRIGSMAGGKAARWVDEDMAD